MLFERTLVVTNKNGEIFKSEIRADNRAIRVPRDGYSGWDGYKWIKGFSVVYTSSRGTLESAWAETRKEAIREAAYCIVPYEHNRDITYKLVKE